MHAIELLAQAYADHPELGMLKWDVDDRLAVADLLRLGFHYLDGMTLVIVPAPDALPWVNRLHAAGWLRDGMYADWDAWELTATLTRGDAQLRVQGITLTPPANKNIGVPWYFAPAPPPLRRGPKFLAEYREWEKQCRALAW